LFVFTNKVMQNPCRVSEPAFFQRFGCGWRNRSSPFVKFSDTGLPVRRDKVVPVTGWNRVGRATERHESLTLVQHATG